MKTFKTPTIKATVRNLRTAKKTVGAKKAKRTGTGLGFSLERQ